MLIHQLRVADTDAPMHNRDILSTRNPISFQHLKRILDRPDLTRRRKRSPLAGRAPMLVRGVADR